MQGTGVLWVAAQGNAVAKLRGLITVPVAIAATVLIALCLKRGGVLMPQYQYKLLIPALSEEGEPIPITEDDLNALGKDGWRVVAAFPRLDGTQGYVLEQG
jgi:hypothetical protein